MAHVYAAIRFRFSFLLLLGALLLGSVASRSFSAQAQALPAGQGLVADSTELRVLHAFYNSTGGPTWRYRTNWPTTATWPTLTVAQVSNWYGVSVTQGDITALTQGANWMTGTLPASLGLLTQLRTLVLYSNSGLAGPLPASLGQLTQLQTMRINDCRFSGSLPPEMGQLTQLQWLAAQGNSFTGSLPASWGQMTQMRTLELSSNQFTGALPTSFGNLTQLQSLRLSSNQLTGPLPASWGQLAQLTYLNLSYNRLTDSIPASWGQMRQLTQLQLRVNQLSGPLPRQLGRLTQLTDLWLNNNQFTGMLPDSLQRLTQLRQLWAQKNKFTGGLRPWIGQLTQLTQLTLEENLLQDTLPAALGQLTQLTLLTLHNNQLKGSIPTSLGQLRQLQTLNLSTNQLTGSLPQTLGRLSRLTSLTANKNQLTGGLPDSLANLPLLTTLNLNSNRFLGTVPAHWGTFASLTSLLLNNNQLEGVDPALGNLAQLLTLDLSYNRLWGPLPATLGQLSQLQTLSLNNNAYTGSIPAAWGGLLACQTLNLSTNRLEGGLPAALAQLPLLTMLNLGSNRLTAVPDFRTYLNKAALTVYIHSNYLSSREIERSFTSANNVLPLKQLIYTTQSPPPTAETDYFVVGTASVQRTRSMDGPHDATLQWQRRVGPSTNWETMTGKTTATVNLGPGTTSLEGEYRIKVTNSWLPNQVYYSRTLNLSMVPYELLPTNEPVTGTTPDLTPATVSSRGAATDAINYVRTYTAREAFTDPAALASAPVDSVQIKTEYLDGLGRPVQTVLRQESPSGRDIVQPVAYDGLSRQPKDYLPYTAPGSNLGSYRPDALFEQDRFYRGTDPTLAALTPHLPKTGVAYAQKSFEASPLNRVVAQGAAGETWALNAASNHAVWQTERPSTAADAVRRWVPGYGGNREELVDAGFYAAGELWVNETSDEQQQRTLTFTDKQGQMVLKRVQAMATSPADTTYTPGNYLQTYYVYDDFDRLRAVLPPKAEQQIRAHNWVVTGAGVERLLFRYHYDDEGRLIEKKVPDMDGYSYVIYDVLDRPILQQDPAQLGRKEWTSTHYDTQGRVVYTALHTFPDLTGTTGDAQRQALQTKATNAQTAVGAIHWEAPNATALLGKAYYSNDAFPSLTVLNGGTVQLLSVNHYDNYDFNHDGTADTDASTTYAAPTAAQLGGTVPVVDLRVTGQLTCSLVRVLNVAENEPGAWLQSTSFFDEKLRPIQVKSRNARGLEDVATTRYDFMGKVLSSYAEHQGPNHQAMAVREAATYDHAGRVLQTTQVVAEAAAANTAPVLETTQQVLLADNHYNELGQLEQKKLGSAPGLIVPLQTVDYRYNIRGWLTRINDVEEVEPADQDLWAFALHYDQGFNTPQYNGNIAGQTWRAYSDRVQRAYGYRYDVVNRLLQGDFVARNAAGVWDGAERNNYRFWAASYDANGNLLTLRRRGLVQRATRRTAAQYAETDNLRYSYTTTGANVASNRLQRVDDLAPAPSTFGASGQPERPDFSNGTTTSATTDEYTYDVAGSLLSDKNKGIATIIYNHLHLPQRITWSNGNQLEYRYTATGQKVAKLATATGKPVVRTDYLGPWQYESDSLRWLSHGEGRLLRLTSRDNIGQLVVRHRYEFNLKDHLGNLRVAFHAGEKKSYTAGLDSDPTQRQHEQRTFDSTSVSAPIRTVVGHQFARSGDGVAKLNAGGTHPQPLGPFKQLTVAKGDTVQITAYGLYQQAPSTSGWSFSLAGFVASLLQQPISATNPTDGSNGRRVRILPLLSVGLGLTRPPSFTAGVPHAYVRLLVYNQDSVLVDQVITPLGGAPGGYDTLLARVAVTQAGYVQAYVANESDVDVYFDDITIEHRQGLQVQENQYDPYGLDLAGLSHSATPENKYTFNGKEKQTEFGLNWHDHGWRFYDPTLGRWVVSDPDAEEGEQESWGTYQFGMDNAVRYNDLDGRAPGDGDMPYIRTGNVMSDIFINHVIMPYVKYAVAGSQYVRNEIDHSTNNSYTSNVPSDVRKVNYQGRKVEAVTKLVEASTEIIETNATLMGPLEAGGMLAAKAAVPLAREVADLGASQMRLGTVGKGKPTMVGAAVDKSTKEIVVSASGKPRPNLVSPLKEQAPNPSVELWPCNNCGETKAVNSLVKGGSKMKDIEHAATRRATGAPEAPCGNCQLTLRGTTVR